MRFLVLFFTFLLVFTNCNSLNTNDALQFELEMFEIDHEKINKKQKLKNIKKFSAKLDKQDDYHRFWHAVSLSMAAKYYGDLRLPLDALNTLKKVRVVFLKLYEKDECMFDGNLALSLAVIHFYAPTWPVSFGDFQKSEEYFEKSKKCYVDETLFLWKYGEFLTTKKPNQRNKGLEFLNTARKNLIQQDNDLALHRIQEVELILNKYGK